MTTYRSRYAHAGYLHDLELSHQCRDCSICCLSIDFSSFFMGRCTAPCVLPPSLNPWWSRFSICLVISSLYALLCFCYAHRLHSLIPSTVVVPKWIRIIRCSTSRRAWPLCCPSVCCGTYERRSCCWVRTAQILFPSWTAAIPFTSWFQTTWYPRRSRPQRQQVSWVELRSCLQQPTEVSSMHFILYSSILLFHILNWRENNIAHVYVTYIMIYDL